ncbi:MAG TPA: ABC transporter ATP-binding protein [Burkholderiales bacterium]
MIELRRLTKSYRTRAGRHYVFRDLNMKLPDDVSIAIMGPNGAGKSTLVRMLGGIERPDAGEILIDRSISWPVGLSAGFQGSMTGRENVKFVCRIHGDRREKMQQRVAFVEDFADIGEYFDMPMITCSAGMQARIKFGTSMAFDFHYYLTDEVFAVGDPVFRRKAQEVFTEKVKESCLILVSHIPQMVRSLCQAGIHVANGQAVFYDNVGDLIEAYEHNQPPKVVA